MAEDFKITVGGEPGPNDVVFDCVSCGRGLCIDGVAAGFAVTCPYCQTEQRVPGEPQEAGPEEDLESQEDAGSGTVMMTDPVAALQNRIAHLESLVVLQQGRFEKISREIGLIQSAMDRVMGTLSDALSGNPPPVEEEDSAEQAP